MERMLSRFDLPRVDSPFVYVQPYWVCNVVKNICFPKFPLKPVVILLDVLNSRVVLCTGTSEVLDNIPARVSITLVPALSTDPGGGIYLRDNTSNIYWPCRIPCDSTV